LNGREVIRPPFDGDVAVLVFPFSKVVLRDGPMELDRAKSAVALTGAGLTSYLTE